MLQRPGGGGGDSLLVIAARVVQAPNDKQQIEPMLERIGTLPEDLGKPETLLADTGYFSEANVALCAAAQIDPMIAQGRQLHYPPLSERFAKVPSAPENPTPLEAMSHRLQTPEGKKLYALRKQIPEPVFGIIQISPPKQDRLSAGPIPDIRWSVSAQPICTTRRLLVVPASPNGMPATTTIESAGRANASASAVSVARSTISS